MLFMLELFEPLHGWVKGYQVTTLWDAINRAIDMQDIVPERKLPLKPYFP